MKNVYTIPGTADIKSCRKFALVMIDKNTLDTIDPMGPDIEIESIFLPKKYSINPTTTLNIREFITFIIVWVPRNKVVILDTTPASMYILNPNIEQMDTATGADN